MTRLSSGSFRIRHFRWRFLQRLAHDASFAVDPLRVRLGGRAAGWEWADEERCLRHFILDADGPPEPPLQLRALPSESALSHSPPPVGCVHYDNCESPLKKLEKRGSRAQEVDANDKCKCVSPGAAVPQPLLTLLDSPDVTTRARLQLAADLECVLSEAVRTRVHNMPLYCRECFASVCSGSDFIEVTCFFDWFDHLVPSHFWFSRSATYLSSCEGCIAFLWWSGFDYACSSCR